jgi:hypothetical protein
VQCAGVDVLLFPKGLWVAGDELFDVVDDTADVVRDPSSRIRGVRAALKGDDLQLWPAFPRL